MHVSASWGHVLIHDTLWVPVVWRAQLAIAFSRLTLCRMGDCQRQALPRIEAGRFAHPSSPLLVAAARSIGLRYLTPVEYLKHVTQHPHDAGVSVDDDVLSSGSERGVRLLRCWATAVLSASE